MRDLSETGQPVNVAARAILPTGRTSVAPPKSEHERARSALDGIRHDLARIGKAKILRGHESRLAEDDGLTVVRHAGRQLDADPDDDGIRGHWLSQSTMMSVTQMATNTTAAQDAN